MKTLSIIALVAAVSAFALFPINFETAMSVIFSLGFASILISDYSRRLRLVEAQARRVPTVGRVVRASSNSHLGLAA